MNRRFYRYLLLALRAHRDDFYAEGPDFHEAFGTAIEDAGDLFGVQPSRDPVFGIYHEATEMILEGEQDLLISLMNPKMQRAQFRITSERAAQELERSPDAAKYQALAERFHQCLKPVRPT